MQVPDQFYSNKSSAPVGQNESTINKSIGKERPNGDAFSRVLERKERQQSKSNSGKGMPESDAEAEGAEEGGAVSAEEETKVESAPFSLFTPVKKKGIVTVPFSEKGAGEEELSTSPISLWKGEALGNKKAPVKGVLESEVLVGEESSAQGAGVSQGASAATAKNEITPPVEGEELVAVAEEQIPLPRQPMSVDVPKGQISAQRPVEVLPKEVAQKAPSDGEEKAPKAGVLRQVVEGGSSENVSTVKEAPLTDKRESVSIGESIALTTPYQRSSTTSRAPLAEQSSMVDGEVPNMPTEVKAPQVIPQTLPPDQMLGKVPVEQQVSARGVPVDVRSVKGKEEVIPENLPEVPEELYAENRVVPGGSKIAVQKKLPQKKLFDQIEEVIDGDRVPELPGIATHKGKPLEEESALSGNPVANAGTVAPEAVVEMAGIAAQQPTVNRSDLPPAEKVQVKAETAAVDPNDVAYVLGSQIPSRERDPIAIHTAPLPSQPLAPKLQEIVDRIVQEVYTISQEGKTDTTIVLQYPPLFQGVQVTITAYGQAPGQLNIAFSNLTTAGKKMLDENLAALRLRLEERTPDFVVQQLTTTTLNEIPRYYSSDTNQQQRERQGEQQSDSSGGDNPFAGREREGQQGRQQQRR